MNSVVIHHYLQYVAIYRYRLQKKCYACDYLIFTIFSLVPIFVSSVSDKGLSFHFISLFTFAFISTYRNLLC